MAKTRRRYHDQTGTTRNPRARSLRAQAKTHAPARPHRAAEQEVRLRLELSALRGHALRLEMKNADLTSRLDQLSDLQESLPVGDLTLDERGVILRANQTAAHLLGYKTNAVLTGIPLSNFAKENEVADFFEHLRQSRLTSEPVSIELELTLPGTRRRAVELITVPFSALRGRPVKALRAILIDITQRDAARKALRATHQNHRAVIDSVHGIVWEADPTTLDVLFVSQSAERILGYPLNTWFNYSFWPNHIYVNDRERVLIEVAKACAAGEGHYTLDYRVLDANRKCLWFRDTMTIFRQEGKMRLLGVAVDITDRKELEQLLTESQALLEKRVEERTAELNVTIGELEAFAYSLSHDLRAPLRAVAGYAEIVCESAGDRLQQREKELLQRISSSAVRLDGLIQDILKYSRVAREPIDLHPINVEDLVRGIMQDYPGLQPPNADIEVQTPLGEVKANEAFLTQCISNLLSNAVKFVKPGGQAKVRVWSEQLDHQVRLWFEDNGIGIAPYARRRIFGIFQRLHPAKEYGGTGIGLAVVKKAAERMGGKVGLESTPGKGSKFWLELPRA